MSIANTIYDGGENYFKDNYSGIDGGMIDPISGEIIGTTGNGMAWTVSDLVKNNLRMTIVEKMFLLSMA